MSALAHSRHSWLHRTWLKRTCLFALHLSAYDPKRILASSQTKTYLRRVCLKTPWRLPKFRKLVPMLQTKDMVRTVAWYQTVLGFERRAEGRWMVLLKP